MKNLFFVSVALGIFSGTNNTVKAQSQVNFTGATVGTGINKPAKFIEGIEINANNANSTTIDYHSTVTPFNTADLHSIPAIENGTFLQFKYAQMMDVDVESINNLALYGFIEDWWATRYRYGGSTKSGIDCSAYSSTLLSEVYKLDISRTARSQFGQCQKIEKEDLKEGDLVFFNTRRGVSHVGVYLKDGYFTHSGTSTGVTISHLDDTYFSKKYIGGGRINLNTSE